MCHGLRKIVSLVLDCFILVPTKIHLKNDLILIIKMIHSSKDNFAKKIKASSTSIESMSARM